MAGGLEGAQGRGRPGPVRAAAQRLALRRAPGLAPLLPVLHNFTFELVFVSEVRWDREACEGGK